MNSLPLLDRKRAPGETFAWRPEGPATVGDFLAAAHWLAGRLPAGDWLLNLCEDRYRFAVGFAAGLIAGKTSLQPSSLSPETLHQLAADYPGLAALCDGETETGNLPRIPFPALPALAPCADVPEIDAEREVAILFTSGSTGLPQPQRKTWGRLVCNARAGASVLGLDACPHNIVGTVPIQHSYGFESTFLLALHGGCPIWSGKPFFPQDIAAALAAVPQPRLLVTTPFHLSALLAADIPLPPVERVLSATAPLTAELAARAEQRCNTCVEEIYGTTESGQLASRRTVDGPAWKCLPEIILTQKAGQTVASGGHVEGEVLLGDVIERLPDNKFLLLGRHADLINIAGKRTSLAYLNHQINAIPGVVDAAFHLPDGDESETPRLTAFVVAPALERQQLLAALRQRIDPIFLPRPLILLDTLPRNSTGKLPREALQALCAKRRQHD
ncbi:MAG: acyl-CoA synthetase [Betaproteobacteria bacterium]|uniref:Long-chain-fatty-acid--CoA ligase n=1 Tax=Candidatus Proximibacter danicus TaxID=2954365 RepID=A0A9D7K422_9PROT|nr:acyl-CoA synthetase [Candidatus Proximibacter danicus]MBK9447537.1 acyl-CoA synthetase [Betaproteobacteria bacterium]